MVCVVFGWEQPEHTEIPVRAASWPNPPFLTFRAPNAQLITATATAAAQATTELENNQIESYSANCAHRGRSVCFWFARCRLLLYLFGCMRASVGVCICVCVCIRRLRLQYISSFMLWKNFPNNRANQVLLECKRAVPHGHRNCSKC